MKPKVLLLILLTAIVASTATWLVARRSPGQIKAAPAERKILYYQSPMHPWIKSDQPGNCTICGMKLVPIYEGDQGFGGSAGLISLGSNIIQTIQVASTEVKRSPLTRTLRVAGVVEDDDTRHHFISAYVDGRIEKLGVNYLGAEVKAGQLLATIYSPMLLNAEREFTSLVRQTNHVAPAELLETQKGMIAAMHQRLRQMGLTDSQIDQVPLKPAEQITSDIVAPLDGTVVARNVYEGQYVKEGDRLFETGDFSKMWFQFDAYERDLPWLRLGQKVEVTAPSVPGRTLTGVITFIDPSLKEVTRSAKVRVELDNPLVEENGQSNRLLRHRVYAEAVVQVEIPEVLAVPRGAVLKPGPQAVVYVNKGGGSFEQRQVKLGRAGDDAWEVLDGLQAGDEVVINGNLLIDAQAQLNASAHAPMPASAPTNTQPVLTETQITAARNLFENANDIAAALAADNLDAFNQQALKLHLEMSALMDGFVGADKVWYPLLEKIEGTAHFEKAADLKAARKSFLPFSTAVVEFARVVRPHDAFKSVKVFQCPMVNKAVPNAPGKKGEWIQLVGPIKNPFYGAEMLDCGTEVTN